MDNIFILNSDFEQIGIISTWKSLIWTDRWNAEGEFNLEIDPSSRNLDKLSKNAMIYLSSERVGVIDYINPVKGTGGDKIMVSGYTIKDITKKRVTIPPPGSAYATYTNKYPDMIVQSLITSHIVSPAVAARAIPHFSVSAASGLGAAINFSSRYKPLQEEIYELLLPDGLGIVCLVDLANQTATFSVKEGVDRTIDQDTNPRALFSLSMGTLGTLDQTLDATTYKNIAYTGGQGEGLDREIIVSGSTASTGWGRDEMFVDARDVATTAELSARASQKLAETAGTFSVSGTAGGNTHIAYALGDYVSIYSDFDGAWHTAQITEIKDTYSAGEAAKRELTIGAALVTVTSLIKRKMSGLQNILTV